MLSYIIDAIISIKIEIKSGIEYEYRLKTLFQ